MVHSHQNRRACGENLRPILLQDLVVTWSGSPASRRRAFAELSPGVAPRCEGGGSWLLVGVDPNEAFEWALRHLWECEIEAPVWLREWIAEWLNRRAQEMLP